MSSSGLADMSHSIASTAGSATAPLAKGISIPQSAWKDPNPKTQKISKSQSFSASSSSNSSSSSSSPSSFNQLSPQQEELAEKKILIGKTEQYLRSPIFQKMGYFKDMNIKIPPETSPLALIKQTYELVRSVVTMESKRMMTHHIFETILSAGEGCATHLFQLHSAVGFAEFCISNSQEFQPEMEEISIEFGNSLIPDPKLRIALKVARMWKSFQDERARGELMNQAKILSQTLGKN